MHPTTDAGRDAARRRGEAVAAAALLAFAGYLGLLGYLAPPGLRMPPAVAYLCSGALAAAGLALAAKLAGRHRLRTRLVALALVAMSGVGAWIGFGPGERSCVVRRTVSDAGTVRGDTECRVVFGAGSIVTLLMAAAALAGAGRGAGRENG